MVSIIIPTRSFKRTKNPRYFYKKLYSINDLLISIKNNIKIKYEIIVIVNGIEDKILLDYVKNSPLINKYAILNKNSGVSRAWNMGRQLSENNLLLFCNDDVFIENKSVEELCNQLTKNKKLAVCGPKGSYWENGKHKSHIDSNSKISPNVISGFCFMIKSKILDEIGGFDINFTPAGYEEVDMCFRVLKKGYEIKILHEILIKTEPAHGISARDTTIKYFDNEINTKDLHKRNTEYFFKKWKIG